MTATQTTLPEFGDSPDTRDAEPTDDREADGPTPAENAAAISSLADVLEEQVGQINEIADRLEQQEPTDSIDTKLADGGRMYQ